MKSLITGFALAMLVMLGASGIASAQVSCANAQSSYMGDVIIGSAGTPCTLGAVSDSNGSITVMGSTITITGTISGFGGVSVGGSAAVQTQALTSSNGGVGVGGTKITISAPVSALSGISISGTKAVTTKTLTSTGPTLVLSVASSGGSVTTTALSSAGTVNVGANPTGTTGDVKITGAVTASNGYVQVRAGGLIKITGAVKATVGGNILLIAQSTLRTGAVTGAPGFNVDLKANQGSGNNSLFTIGGSGQANGVNGKITGKASGSLGDVVYVTNGATGSTGGITVTASTDLVNSGTKVRYIILNAQNGTLNMPTGTLAVNGGSGSAGQIQLLANTVTFADNATLSAMQTSTTGSLHGVAISATTINYGATNLTIIADGNGTTPNGAFAYLLAQGDTTITDPANDIFHLDITVDNTGRMQQPLTVNGAGLLKISANGDQTKVAVNAYPISFTGGQILLQATGATNHVVDIENPQPFTNKPGLTFGGTTAAVTLDASGVNGPGGLVLLFVDQAVVNAPSFIVNANASNGNQIGGTASITFTTMTLSASTAGSITANGGSTGGNGGYILLSGNGTLNIGSGGGNFNLAATASSGTAGTIEITNETTLNVNGANVSVAAMGTANGGIINIHNIGTLNFLPTAPTALAADGSGPGNGGSITLDAFNAITVGNGSDQVSLSAQGDLNGGTGNGGSVSINSHFSPATVSGSSINVAGGPNKTGGNITVTTLNTLSLSGNLNANGLGTGAGGNIVLTAGAFTFNGTESFTANSTGTGKGGTVTLDSTFAGNMTTWILGVNTTLQALSANGPGGIINITSASQPLTITGDGVLVTAGGNGAGGAINVTAAANTLTITGTLSANGSGTGAGGLITLLENSNFSILLNGATISAAAAPASDGNGGTIIIVNTGGGINLSGTTLDAQGAGSGAGGTITVSVLSSNPIDLTQSGTSITANGGATGTMGGSVTIGSTSPTFDVNEVIKVNAGSGANTNLALDGSISLNGIPCQQYATGSTSPSWPTSFWDCTGSTPSEIQSNVASGLIQSLQTLLGSHKVQLYTLNNPAAFNSFFTAMPPDPAVALGDTFTLTNPPTGTIFSTVNVSPVNSFQQNETSAHELGHAIDFSNTVGTTQPSGSTTYELYTVNDWLYLDYSTVAGTELNSTYRLPCVTTGSTPGPLVGVLDANNGNEQYCTGGVLNDPGHQYGNLTNSAILQIAEPHIFMTDSDGGWSEEYAQTFAFKDYAFQNIGTPIDLTHVTADTLFNQNVNMVCTVDWAAAVKTGATTPPTNAPAYCSAALPGWNPPYKPFGTKTHQ